MTVTQATDGSELCMSCGLCCDGLLHHNVSLSPGERAWAEEKGAPVGVTAAKDPCLDLPCVFLKGTLCSVYAERPFGCRAYRCGLLDRYVAGDIALGQAQELVTEGRRILESAKASLEPGQTLRQAKREWQRNGGTLAQEEIDPARLSRHLRMTALHVFADRHFKSDREEPLVELK